MKKKVLFIRLDKIGDLICTLPADQVLGDDCDVTWAVQKGMGQVVELGEKNRRFIELDKNDPATAARMLREFLKDFKPDIAISFQCPWWVNYELFKARVPARSGVKSQWHSFLFLNRGVRQRRSLAEKHELDYNLDLVYEAFGLRPSKMFLSFVIAPVITGEILEKFHLSTGDYTVVHPGMMGSALNWSQSRYISYIHQEILRGKQVVITGTDSDDIYLDQIKKELFQNPKVTWLQSKLNLKELVQVLANADHVLAPSTGVAHLAAAVGAKVTVIMSPVRVHHPKRWGPRGPHVEIVMIEEKI